MCLVIGKLQFTTANFHVVMSKMSAQFYCFVLGIVLYSEENVWKLCQDASLRVPEELDRCYVVFISNPCRTVPLWKQRAGREEDRLVIWVCTYRNCVMHAIPTQHVLYDFQRHQIFHMIGPLLTLLTYFFFQDYHVIFLYSWDCKTCLVYDLDSELPFPTFFHKYVTETFRTDQVLKSDFHR